ncbi:MAG TPA: hypothetical protein DCS05_00500 [Nitrospiraceae bacterium]|nr:hypothetical protein [Nitrospiraceae bacterium]
MIRIYPSKLDGAPIETYSIACAVSIEEFICGKAPSYSRQDPPPISVSVNGQTVETSKWADAIIHPADAVDICVEAKGLDPFTVTYLMVVGTQKLVSMLVRVPSMSASAGGTRKGDALSEATAKANQAKLNSIIREVAGTFKVYPDYLLPMHRYFVNKKEQWAETLLCVGKGEFEIPASSILIGDTRIISLGDDADYSIHAPGADLSALTAAKWWHYAPEVGGTSTGKAGLELNAAYDAAPVPSASSYQFNSVTVTIPTGAGFFPAGWIVGMNLRVEEFLDYTVVEGWSDRDMIYGDFTSLQPFGGMVIEITGDNAGFYTIYEYISDSDGDRITLNYDDGSQVNGLWTGTRRMSIAYRGSKYQITGLTSDVGGNITALDVDRYTDEGIIDATWTGFGFAIVNDAVIQLDGSGIEGGWVGPFAACPDGEATSTVEYDIMFPGGLAEIGGNGAVNPKSVVVELQWQDMGNPTGWTSVQKTYTESSLDQMGFTETLSLPGTIRPEIRMRRVGAKSTSTSVQDTVQWYALKANLAAPSSYAGVTTMTVSVRGGDRLSAQTDNQISVKATRKLPTRSGGAWTAPTATRGVVPWVCYVLKSMGYADSDIDMVAMDALDSLLNSRGDFYDFSVESQGTVKGELANALRAGFAEFTLDRGAIKPVRDGVRTVYEHMYTPQNMAEQLTRAFATLGPDDFDGVDVEYIDDTTWAKETVQCRLTGDLGVKVEKISLEGVTDRTRAWRIGMRQRRAHRYRRWNYEFATELDALNSSYLSFCALGDDVPGYSQSAILLEAVVGDAVILKSSEPFTWTDGESHVVGIRRPDGTLSGPYAATRISDTLLEIPSIDFVPDTSGVLEPPHLIFGTLTRWSYPALITSIAHGGNKVSVEAINYDARVYADDDNSPA